MELHPEEISKVKDIISKWLSNDTMELESTVNMPINATSFMEVAQRLTSKGYTALPQEDHIKILTPENIRFTIVGMSSIEEYCRSDNLETAPFEAMIKDRTGKEDSVDLPEYGIRVKVRRELPLANTDVDIKAMLKGWASKKKAFRILRRWTFVGEGLRYDLSMVRSTPMKRGQFDWQTTFRQRDLTKTEPTYEIEVELARPDKPETDTMPFMKTLVRGVGEVLRGLQKHHILMRKSKSRAVISAYQALTGTERFRGVAPITMILDNMRKERVPRVPNIRDGYNVTDKADGTRMMGFTTAKGELYMIDMTFNVYRTGLIVETLKDSLLDGEYVTRDIDGNPIVQFILFDAYIVNGVDISQKPFAGEDGRHTALLKWVTIWNSGGGPATAIALTDKSKIMVSMKTFKFASPGDKEIFDRCKEVLDTKTGYHTDGLILTPNKDPLPARPGVAFHAQLKWKPAEENTVDFLCSIEKASGSVEDEITTSILPSGEFVQFKTLRLFVGSDLDPAYENPRGTILFRQPLPGSVATKRGVGMKVPYKPVLFNPRDIPDTMSGVCYIKIESDPITNDSIIRCENDGDAIQDRSIVEMRYDASKEPGWRWIPMRIRYDKTERYQKALKTGNFGGTMNKDTAAEGVWNSIHEPITRSMIRTGTEQPSSEEVKSALTPSGVTRVYYDRKGPKQDLQSVQGLRAFHNRFIKEGILLSTGLKGGKKVLMDLACGQGGDLVKWVREDVAFVFGVDVAGEGIRDPMNGIYRRYLNQILENGGYDSIGNMVFAIGTSAKNIASGEAGSTPEESDIMRSVLGKVNPNGPVPPFVLEKAAGRLREGADCIAIMFALHYFFESEATLTGLIQNINDSLKVGGVFIGCCFDGKTIFDSLRVLPEGGTKVGQDGSTEIWKIKKMYPNTYLPSDSQGLGLPIEVDFISIGTSQVEYLMNFAILTERMNEIGCYIMNKQECADAGLPYAESTGMFSDTYDVAKKQKQVFAMSPAVREYSFYNRWFIFKRKSTSRLESTAAAPTTAPTATAPSATAPTTAPSATAPTTAPTTAPAATIPEGGAAAAAAATTSQKMKYQATQLIQFYIDSPLTDKLAVGDVEAIRWLGPYAPVPIKDEAGVSYPTIEHFMAAMLYSVATNKPHLATSLFSEEQGEIHKEFLTDRARKLQTIKAKNPKIEPMMTKAEEYLLLKNEIAKVNVKLSTTEPEGLYSYKGIQFDEGKWLSVRAGFLSYALKQRWAIDPLLRKTVEAARDKAKILVYYTGENSGSYLGATFRSTTKTLDGQNAYGIELMKLGGFRSI
jgi:SAM-dependent methyltransferase